MYKKLAAIIFAFVMALGLTLGSSALPSAAPDSNPVLKAVAPAPAAAAWGTAVTHASDDSGYTAPIHVVCNGGRHVYLYTGQSTFMNSGTYEGCPYSGVDRIVVGLGQTVYCKNYAPPYENTYFYTGTNYVPSNRTYKCYMQRPL